jgi:solute carrier family 25 aspartate/glutamate transporter 12/13
LHTVGNIPGANFLIRAAQHFGGGGVAGAVGATVVYPLDTIKTRMQAQSSLVRFFLLSVFLMSLDC